jgi:transcriptional regulator with XRE-family HTH domain
MTSASGFNGHNSTFAKRLRELMESREITQQRLANEIGTSRQAVSQYMDGSVQPNIEKLYKAAMFFCVSTDYLLGISDTSSLDTNVQAVEKLTGLNEKSIKTIDVYMTYLGKNFINKLLYNDDFFNMLDNLFHVEYYSRDFKRKHGAKIGQPRSIEDAIRPLYNDLIGDEYQELKELETEIIKYKHYGEDNYRKLVYSFSDDFNNTFGNDEPFITQRIDRLLNGGREFRLFHVRDEEE